MNDTNETRYRYAIIGTGRPHGSPGATGFGMAHPHYNGFRATGRTDLVAVADTDDGRARAFLADYNEDATIYADYREMLRSEKPDIVSVTVWPHLHAEMSVAACEAGARAVHCEKPMATTWADAKRMKAAADAHGTILTFNHQRRFLEPFQKAAQIIRDARPRHAAAWRNKTAGAAGRCNGRGGSASGTGIPNAAGPGRSSSS